MWVTQANDLEPIALRLRSSIPCGLEPPCLSFFALRSHWIETRVGARRLPQPAAVRPMEDGPDVLSVVPPVALPKPLFRAAAHRLE
jgi:hypothetical protein